LTKTNANGRIYQSISSSGVRSISIYAKAGTLDWVRLQVIDAINNPNVFFDLQNGVIGVNAGANYVDSSIESIGTDGWYRIRITFDKAITLFNIYPAEGDEDTSGTSGSIYIQDAQLEIGLAATDYIESGATTGKAGLLEDEPRFDYSGGATCPSLLLEPSRTQLIPQTEYFDDWDINLAGISSIESNYAISPEGLQNAYKVNFVVQSDSDLALVKGHSVTGGSTYAYSIYIKGEGSDIGKDIVIKSKRSGGDSAGTNTLQTLTGEWKRIDFTTTYAANNTAANFYISSNDADSCLIYGAQAELGSYPTSYIPNHSGGTITRGADAPILTGASSLIGQTEGTFFLDWDIIDGIGDRYIGLTSTDNVINFYRTNAGVRVFISANDSAVFNSATLNNIDGRNKLAMSYASGDIKVYLNGSEAETSTATFTFSNPLDVIDFQIASKNNKTRIYQCLTIPEALSGTDLATLTTL
jgi:hypothetical protein